MIRFLKALVLVPVAVLVVLLAVANRAPVVVSLDPFSQAAPEFSVELPLFAVIFAAVMAGVFIGGTAAWLAQGKHRRERRRFRREAGNLRGEADRLRAQAAASAPSGASRRAPGLPALPPSRSSTF